MKSKAHDALFSLSKQARLALAERLWLSVADERTLEVPAEHKSVLKARLADYKAGKSKPISHEELMRRVRLA